MSTERYRRPLPLMTERGQARFLLGVNYWSRVAGPRMWERARFDPELIRGELAQMKQIGLNTCRSFAFIPTFMPSGGRVAPGAVARLDRFIGLCEAEGIWTIPSFLVGHMSGENYDFPGQGARCLYSDPELLSWQRQLVRAVTTAAAPHAAVIGYLASNEMPRWGGAASPETIAAWATALREELRAIDGERPFGLGDGLMNLDGGEDGFNPTRLGPLIDFVGPHSYYSDADPLRQALNVELCVRSLTYLGVPVLLEEFGCSSCQASEAHQATFYREVLHACLTAGGAGALSWCFSDFDLVDEPPYAHHAFELGFGLTTADGREKPVCDELRRFADLVDGLGYHRIETPDPSAAIVVPSYFNTTYPFCWEDRGRMRRTLLQAYVLCVGAGVEVELVPEEDLGRLARYPLLLLPSTQKLLAPTWRFLGEHATAGHTVYWSYFGGDHPFHQGPWCDRFEALTGCRHQLRYGQADVPPPRLSIRGSGLGIDIDLPPAVGGPFPRAMLPVEPLASRGTEVLATGHEQHPALTRVRHGERGGRWLLLTYPVEHYLGCQDDTSERSAAHQLYRLLAREAGVTPLIDCDRPQIQRRLLRRGDERLLWLINHGWSTVQASVDTPAGTPIHGCDWPLAGGRQQICLEPKQVAVFRLDSDA